MNYSITVAVLLVIAASALDFQNRRFTGRNFRRHALGMKSFHPKRPAAKIHKNFLPESKNYFTTTIKVGKSKKEFTVSVETGTDQAWLLDTSYPYKWKNTTTFDATDPTSTATKIGDFNTTVGPWNWKFAGKLYSDVVEYVVPVNQVFGSLEKNLEDMDIEFDRVSGVLGLAWNDSLKDQPVTSSSAPILNIFAALPDQPRFFVQSIKRDDKGQVASTAIEFGNELSEICDPTPIFTLPLQFGSNPHAPTFKLDSFAVKNQKVQGGSVVVDSGTSVILAPDNAFNDILIAIPLYYDWDIGRYTLGCTSKHADLVFSMNGVEIRVSSSDYVLDIGLGNNECLFAVDERIDVGTEWTFGIPFFYERCIKFNIDESTIEFQNFISSSD
ncbi:Peptidase A1 domain-containing protein [Aphelenchoides besseyi]|nr:Peptidase A1 domain-containing protein [Aphelenchoides besseyi]